MIPLTNDKQETILRNIYRAAGFERLHFTKPKIILVNDQQRVNAEMNRLRLEGIGVGRVSEASPFTPADHPKFEEEKVSFHDLNHIAHRLRQYGILEAFFIVTKKGDKVGSSNPPYLFVTPNWETFDFKEYAFECRSLILDEK